MAMMIDDDEDDGDDDCKTDEDDFDVWSVLWITFVVSTWLAQQI